MADPDQRAEYSARILCDPDNYDWPDGHPPDTARSSVFMPIRGFSNLRPPSQPLNVHSSSPADPGQPPLDPVMPTSPRPYNSDCKSFSETFGETEMRLSNHFIPVIEQHADTLIYIGAPPQQKDQPDFDYEYVKREFQHPYLMRSATLRDLGSAKFDDFLGPKSARVQRKLQKAGVHKFTSQIANIKYFIDLTPDIHDDEGLILLSLLSVPAGARAWHQQAKRFNVSPSHVCGRDSLDAPVKPTQTAMTHKGPTGGDDSDVQSIFVDQEISDDYNNSFQRSNAQQLGLQAQRAGIQAQQVEFQNYQATKSVNDARYDLPSEDDYSQLRHHMAIKRLLHAIAGNDPKLNSAPKAWTFCMLAQFFDCLKMPTVSRWVTEWLIQSSNLNFIQANPSTAYRLGMALEAVWLVRSSFCIMVGQKAFASAASDSVFVETAKPEPPSLITDGLDDDEINRVDHAASALSKRIKNSLDHLFGSGSDWSDCCKPQSQMEKLYDLKSDDVHEQNTLTNAKMDLNNYIRRLMYSAFFEYSFTEAKIENLTKLGRFSNYNQVPPRLRPFTMTFWDYLKQETFQNDHKISSAQFMEVSNSRRWQRVLADLDGQGVLSAEDANISYVSIAALVAAIDRANDIFFEPKHQQGPSHPRKKVKVSPPEKDIQTFQIEDDNAHYDGVALAQSKLEVGSGSLTDLTGGTISPPRKRLHDTAYGFVSEEVISHDSDDDTDEWEDVQQEHRSQLECSQSVGIRADQALPIRSKSLPSSAEPFFPMSSSVFPSSGGFEQSMVVGTAHSSQVVSRYGNPEKPVPPINPAAPVPGADLLLKDSRLAIRPRQDYDQSTAPTKISRFLEGFSQKLRFGPSSPTMEMSSFPAVPNHSPTGETGGAFPPRKWRVTNHSEPQGEILVDELLDEIHAYVSGLVRPMLQVGFVDDDFCAYEIPVNEIATLTCLTDDEFKYLPLWAGGNEDGTGGVYDDGEEIPEAPEVEYGGFRGGAMGIIPGVGSSIGGSHAGSEFEEITTEVGVSTVGKASRLATDGTETVMSLNE